MKPKFSQPFNGMAANSDREPQGIAPPTSEVSAGLFGLHNGARYRTPVDLQIAADPGARYLVVGGCLAEPMCEVGSGINGAYKGDFLLLNNFDSFPQIPAEQAAQYDFQIVHIPLRSVMGSAFFRLPDTAAAHEEFLRQTEDHLRRYLGNVLQLNTERKLLTFVLGFLIPQQNPLGRFQPRYELRNVMHFIERLNMFLAAEMAARENAYLLDIDQVSSSIGKKSCQDDMVWSFTHGTTLSDGDHEHDLQRLDPPAAMQKHYAAKWVEFFEAVMHEIFAMYRTVGQREMVKLVVVDLDDTLWRGVAAEGTLGILEGWPMGFMETLLILKRRGILLAIISKNDERFILGNWDNIVQGQIALEDFAAYRINFRSKADNLAEILQELNLQPVNAVMIDDNAAERAAVQAALPKVRVLGKHLYYLKRVLLWSAETQQRAISAESAHRTEMMHAQSRRDSVRKELSQEEFLQALNLRASIARVSSTSDLHMSRALELFNKTNQFNTTGERYTLAQCHERFVAGYELYVGTAEDRFTRYGLVTAAWMLRNCIDHVVMSCRALGLGLEDALLAYLTTRLADPRSGILLARLQPTDANLACREIYSRNGFTQVLENPTFWARSLDNPLHSPAHVSVCTAHGK
jgi:FkbH-like protein